MSYDITFHYPPELMNLLVDTIPLLNKSKKDVFLFFQGAGVSESLMKATKSQWKRDSENISKYEIVRQILTKLNVEGEKCLRERREVLKRVVEFESFSACWQADQLKARGLVSEIRNVINVKDSFTRIKKERDDEANARKEAKIKELDIIKSKNDSIQKIKQELNALFALKDPHKRGKALESTINSLFKCYEILVREAFTLKGSEKEGIVEQIDGVIELDNDLYFVEMKWWDNPIGVSEISPHLVRVFSRSESRAIIISASDFTAPAVKISKEALQQKVVVLCTLEEIVFMIENNNDLKDFFKKKVRAAIIDKNPYLKTK
jgi:restriction system protein